MSFVSIILLELRDCINKFTNVRVKILSFFILQNQPEKLKMQAVPMVKMSGTDICNRLHPAIMTYSFLVLVLIW